MPRRRSADPLAQAIGARIRQLREEQGLTQERLAYESELGSKGHLSDIENGHTRPSVRTLMVLAERLGVDLLDMVTFPVQDRRHQLIDRTRKLSAEALKKLLLDLGEEPPKKPRR